jgi:hypothetical protein
MWIGYPQDKCQHFVLCSLPAAKFERQECPTWWRLYEYLSEDERQKTLQQRREKSSLRIGFGGEGYIAEDDWCHNCGDCGHLGDVCRLIFPDVPLKLTLPSGL